MDFKGGYNVALTGRPNSSVETVPEPDVLYVPLSSNRFSFTEILVAENEHVARGQALALDPDNFSVPLLAPRAGRIRLDQVAGHIVIEEVESASNDTVPPNPELEHVADTSSSADTRRDKINAMVAGGVWHRLHDAHSGKVPDPAIDPQAVIVSTVVSEPFRCRGDALLRLWINEFMRGLEHIQSLLEYQKIYLAMPPNQSKLAVKLLDMLRGHAFVKVILVDMKYPNYDFRILARALGLKKEAGQPVWGLDVDGVISVDIALGTGRPAIDRVISVGGPGITKPCHLKVVAGYPIKKLIESRVSVETPRVVNGGVLRGATVPADQMGLDIECDGLTVLSGKVDRELLGFMRPGFDRRSYSKCFASVLRGEFAERFTIALRGERRPCVSCGQCVTVCPAGIMPNLIHKYAFQDAIEEAEIARVDLCVGCGLCSYVCPSKIDLRQQMIDTQAALDELHAEETV